MMKKSVRSKISLLFLAFFAISMSSIAQAPQRIISLAPSLTKELVLLGLEDQIIGITNYCFIPNKEKYQVVASAVDINLEKVITLKPDLVLATSLSKPESLEILKNAGVRVEYFKLPTSFLEINSQFIEIGKMCGVEEVAYKIVSLQENKMKQLISKVNKSENPRMFFEIGTNPLWCVIPNTFMDDFISFAGGKNIAHDMGNGAVSRESVLIRDPEIIIVATMGNVGKEEIKVWQNYSHLSAVKNNMILVIDSDLACSPTPVHFVETLEAIINFIHKQE